LPFSQSNDLVVQMRGLRTLGLLDPIEPEFIDDQ